MLLIPTNSTKQESLLMKRVIYSDRNILFRRGRRKDFYSILLPDKLSFFKSLQSTIFTNMKKLSFFLIITTFFAISCTKDEIVAQNSTSTLTGEWRWVSSTGGIAGITITPETAGYERKLVLTDDMKYSRYKDNVLQKSGKFELTKEKSIYKTELVDFIKFDDATKSVIQGNTSDELLLADNFYDGFGETFKRIK